MHRRDFLLNSAVLAAALVLPLPAFASPAAPVEPLIGVSVRCFYSIGQDVAEADIAAIYLSSGNQHWVEDVLAINWRRQADHEPLSRDFYLTMAEVCQVIRRLHVSGKLKPRPEGWPTAGSDWMRGDNPATWRKAELPFRAPGAIPTRHAWVIRRENTA